MSFDKSLVQNQAFCKNYCNNRMPCRIDMKFSPFLTVKHANLLTFLKNISPPLGFGSRCPQRIVYRVGLFVPITNIFLFKIIAAISDDEHAVVFGWHGRLQCDTLCVDSHKVEHSHWWFNHKHNKLYMLFRIVIQYNVYRKSEFWRSVEKTDQENLETNDH